MGNAVSVSLDPSRCLDCTIARAKYVSDLPDNLAALKKERKNLIDLREDMIRKINLDEKGQMKRKNQVQRWLQTVEDVVAEVDQLLTAESQETEKLCFGGCCSKDYKSSYKYGKQVRRKLQLVADSKNEGRDFGDNVAEKVPQDPVNKIPFDPIIIGQETIFDKVWSCLRKEEMGIVGLFGTGGVGKTTLLTQINNRFWDDEQRDFDVVIWTVVSKELRLEKIQEEIGKRTGLWDEKWKDKTLQEKAQDIFKTLSQQRFILLLDDVWDQVDLKEVGVPIPSPNTTSKVIFTTRFEEVCGKMNAHKYFRVECLGRDEAWQLFRKTLQGVELDSNPDILELAKEVAEECGGLPLVIKTIAQAMTCNKTPEEWDYAIQVLKTSPGIFSNMEKVYHRLKFSYNRLSNDKIRSCFKYCCLFPEDHLIFKRDLIDCWIGEGFLDEFDGRVLINQGYTIINTLTRACLLEEEGNDCVKMHDVIRDMALWITCEVEKEKENYFVGAIVGLTKAVEASKWEGVRRMSLMNNKIESLGNAPRSPSLVTLFLNGNKISTIPDNFFQFMPSLRVLNLSHNDLEELPLGISKLVLLEYLNLEYTGIRALPEELKTLVNLKCLILEQHHLDCLCMIPRQMISNFSRLQVLRMPLCSPEKAPKDSILFGGDENLVEELLQLDHLSVLTVTIRSLDALKKLLSAPLRLQSCNLDLVFFDKTKSFDILSLTCVEHLKELLLASAYLEVLEMNLASHSFKNLHTVTVSCYKLKETTWLIFAPNLKKIKFLYCDELEEVISKEKLGEDSEIMKNLSPFSKLQFLTFVFAEKLTSIYWEALPFPELEEINVWMCPNLKKLPLNSNSTKEHKIVIRGEEYWGEELQWEDQATQNAFLPSFRSTNRSSAIEARLFELRNAYARRNLKSEL